MPKEIIEAKKFIVRAQQLESNEDFEEAAQSYNSAHDLWPDNVKISNRLATLYLVNLGMNSKAVHYAKKSLINDPQNTEAALYAAIGSANMQRLDEAKEYFSHAISGNPPMKEALLSYAAFSENHNHNDAALTLLDKYESNFGEDLNSMLSKARILDKIGKTNAAYKQYRAILASGFQMRPDLTEYIKARLSSNDKTLNN